MEYQYAISGQEKLEQEKDFLYAIPQQVANQEFEPIYYDNSFRVIDENTINELRQTHQENNFARTLIKTIKEQHFEDGIYSNADLLVKKQLAINSLSTKAILNKLFIEYSNSSNIIVGLLQLVARIDESLIIPEGHIMAMASLSDKNIEVRECAIACFESWASTKSLEILKNTTVIQPEWLQNYLNQVINNIENELCLYS